MIIDDSTALAILRAVSDACQGRSGHAVRAAEVLRYTSLDPAIAKAALRELVMNKLLTLGATDDRVALNVAGGQYVLSRVERGV